MDYVSESKEFTKEYNRFIDNPDVKDADDIYRHKLEQDGLLTTELAVKRNGGETLECGKVKRRAVGEDGKPLGCKHESGNTL